LLVDEFETGTPATDQAEVKPAVKVVMSPEAAAAAAQAAEAAEDDEDITVEVKREVICLLTGCPKHVFSVDSCSKISIR